MTAYVVILKPTNANWHAGAAVIARGPGRDAQPGDLFAVPDAFAVEFAQSDRFRFIDGTTYAELCAVRDAAVAEAEARQRRRDAEEAEEAARLAAVNARRAAITEARAERERAEREEAEAPALAAAEAAAEAARVRLRDDLAALVRDAAGAK